MNIRRALSDVATMRAQLEKIEGYRSFRSLATGLSALVVITGAVVQQMIVR